MEKKHTTLNETSGAQNSVWLARAASDNAAPGLPVDPQNRASTSLHERESIRRSVPCSILVNFGATYAIASNILDISLSGAYVELVASGLQLGDAVEVVLGFSYQAKQIELRIPATIVRLQSGGVGLKFVTYDNHTYTDLVNLLYAA